MWLSAVCLPSSTSPVCQVTSELQTPGLPVYEPCFPNQAEIRLKRIRVCHEINTVLSICIDIWLGCKNVTVCQFGGKAESYNV